MEREWPLVPLSQCGTWLSGGTPYKSLPEYWTGQIPWVSPKDMNVRFIRDSQDHVSEAGVVNGSRLVPPHTILFVVRSMTLAHTFQIAITEREVAFNQDLKAIVCNHSVYPRFLFYALLARTDTILGLVDEASHGTKRLRTDAMESLLIPLPSLPEQRAIASMLGALDDKIELNRRMNETLEAIARALFTSWFVDFDPVRAKVEGREPAGMDAETASLFPNAFDIAHVEEMPAGWRLGSLGDLCDITMGQSPPGNTYNEIGDGLPFYQGIRDFGFRYPRRRIYCSAPTREAAADDVLLSVRAPVGSLNVASERCAIGRGVAALRLKQEHCGFLYYLLKATASGWDKFNAEGTVFGSVSKSGVSSFACLVPDASLRRAFSKRVAPIDHHIFLNTIQVDSLSELRDALLPKLLSGEVRVREAERLVEAAV